MTGNTVTKRLEEADSLAVLLDAAYEAFEVIMSMIAGREDSAGTSLAAFVFAAAAAADGRDSIAAAPSLPKTPLQQRSASAARPGPGESAEDLAAGLASLSGLLAVRLAQAAKSATGHQDRAACHEGARQAREILVLLAGNEP
jgi:hypothetical protein